MLLKDVAAIESDQVPLPSYEDDNYPVTKERSGVEDGGDELKTSEEKPSY